MQTQSILIAKLTPALALVLVVAPLTIGAVRSFPLYDDAWLWLLLKEQGVGAILPSLPDRPVIATLWWWLASTEQAFWGAVFLTHGVLWAMLGVCAGYLWRVFLPDFRRYIWLVASLTVAPLGGFNIQLYTASITTMSLLSTVLAYVGAVLIFRFVEVSKPDRRLAFAGGLGLLAIGILVSEYALSASLVIILLLFGYGWTSSIAPIRVRAYRAAILLSMVVPAVFAGYVLLAEWNANPNVYAPHPYIVSMPTVAVFIKFMHAMYQGAAGNLLISLGSIHLTSWSGLLAVGYGILVAALVVLTCLTPTERSPSRVPATRLFAVLFSAIGVGLLPVVLAGESPWNPNDVMNVATARFGIPVLPVVASLSLYTGLCLVRRRFWTVPIFILGFAAGHASFTEAWAAVKYKGELSTIGALLQPYVAASEGLTVAVISSQTRQMGPPLEWELTAQIAHTWTPELRQRFWAYRYGGNPAIVVHREEASQIFGSRATCTRPTEFKTEVRLVKREGPLHRLLWVEHLLKGGISIEPYCLTDLPHGVRASSE